ncbi:MAG: hypothetical protein Q3M24_14980 [Candidatus Electrothrix aestuarii]|uniref:Uncharacterized protein n=1 Tax=Candidatus Electrothrix aestuarii TaxID=3062594 RepID=A0AAU8LRS4_9BACT|nr:hypothetical protein [Candidatus Electrothrix aestuarii]
MPSTKFRLKFDNDDKTYSQLITAGFNINKFKSMLPDNFRLHEEGDKLHITIETIRDDDLANSKPLLDRELKRFYFFTNMEVEYQHITVRGTIRVEQLHTMTISSVNNLPEDIGKQNWNDKISLQFSLWHLASKENDVKTKILIYYQILELSEYAFDKYQNPNESPDPLNECRFLRHLVAHGNIDNDNKQMKAYLKYLEKNKTPYGRIKTEAIAVST